MKKSKIMKEDPNLSRKRHGLATLNGHKFYYRRPDGKFLWDIYHAMFLKLRGLKMFFNENTFPHDMATIDESDRLKRLKIIVYLDMASDNHRNATTGELTVEFPLGPELHPYKPTYPNRPPVAPTENSIDRYTIPVNYRSKGDKSRLYQIEFYVNPDFTAVPVWFSGEYVDPCDEGGYPRLNFPNEWKSFSGHRTPKIDNSEEILPISKRSTQMDKKRDADQVTEVKAQVPVSNPSATKKARPEIDLASSKTSLNSSSGDPEFEGRAHWYAVEVLIKKEDVRREAIKEFQERYHQEIAEKTSLALQEREIKDIMSDPIRKESFSQLVRDLAARKLLISEEKKIREEVRAVLKEEERKKAEELRLEAEKTKLLAEQRLSLLKFQSTRNIPPALDSIIRSSADQTFTGPLPLN